MTCKTEFINDKTEKAKYPLNDDFKAVYFSCTLMGINLMTGTLGPFLLALLQLWFCDQTKFGARQILVMLQCFKRILMLTWSRNLVSIQNLRIWIYFCLCFWFGLAPTLVLMIKPKLEQESHYLRCTVSNICFMSNLSVNLVLDSKFIYQNLFLSLI